MTFQPQVPKDTASQHCKFEFKVSLISFANSAPSDISGKT